jgi:hypothetical protein
MSCNRCGNNHTSDKCYEARLSLGFDDNQTMIVGTLDGVPIIPLRLKSAVQKNETNTNLKYDQNAKALIFENERYKNGDGAVDSVLISQLLSGAQLSQLGGVGGFIEGGLASIIDGALSFDVPEPVQTNELASGFVAYVPSPISGSRYKIVKPAPGGDSDTLLVGHPNGSIEFAVPLPAPIAMPVANMTGSGVFSGAPAVNSGSFYYQTMGTTDVITNTSGSDVEVELFFRYGMPAPSGGRRGVYCNLVNGGTDFQTHFVEGITNIKSEGSIGGNARFRCILSPNQKCQFEFGGWANASGTMTLTIGSINEGGETAVSPVITQRRMI